MSWHGHALWIEHQKLSIRMKKKKVFGLRTRGKTTEIYNDKFERSVKREEDRVKRRYNFR